jgi:hypothetical protein
MPTIADVAPIAKTLGQILIGEPRTHGALTVTPLLAPLTTDPDWLTLAEAGARIRITEVSESGAVPDLRVVNGADRPLLLLDGRELVGAKQHRVLDMTVLVAAHAEVVIPVSCVEQGRWRYQARDLAPGDASLFASIRGKKAAWVTASLRATGLHRADQAGVWDKLAAKHAAHGVASPTGAMRDFYERYDQEIAQARPALAPVAGQVGAVVHLSGRWVGLDLLAGPRLFARAWALLGAGYAADAIGRKPGAPPRPDVDALLGALLAAPVEPAPAVGLGEEHRIGGERMAGAALVAEDRIAHLMAFPAVPRRRQRGR